MLWQRNPKTDAIVVFAAVEARVKAKAQGKIQLTMALRPWMKKNKEKYQVKAAMLHTAADVEVETDFHQ